MSEKLYADETIRVPSAGGRPGRPRWRRVLRRVGRASVTAVVAVLAALGLLVGLTPSVNDAALRVTSQAAATGAGQLLSAPPARLASAVVAVEDHRFYQHLGVDPLAVARVAAGAVRGRDEGGSTIDIQLAKVLYTGGRADWRAQLEQVGLALKLDRRYSKKTLLTMYLNVVYFGHGFFGAAAAAQGYFGVAPDGLDWGQAALLAGLLQDPDGDDPIDHPHQALARRNYALARLADVGALSDGDAHRFEATGLELRA
jgi:penicillin-binding protein 1A